LRTLALAAFALVLGAAPRASAQDAYFTFERFTTEDGLSNLDVNQVLVDRAGFLWCATAEGLNRYDGTGFTVYRHEPDDSLSLAASWIDRIWEDGGGTLWLQHFTEGITRFDPARGEARLFAHDPGDSTSLPAGDIRDVVEDRRGRLWIAVGREGLCRYDPDRRAFAREGKPLAGRDVTVTAKGADGSLWVGTRDGGLFLFDPERLTTRPITLPGAGSVDRILPERADLVRVVTGEGVFTVRSSDEGWRAAPATEIPASTRLLEPSPSRPGTYWAVFDTSRVAAWDPARGTWTPIGRGADAPTYPMRVSALHEDREGTLWCATNVGLFARLRGTASFRRVPATVRGGGGILLFPAVTSVCEDQGGLLWFATRGSGLYKLNPRQLQFHHDFFSPRFLGEADPLTVTAIHRDGNGVLWLGTLGRGLQRYDRVTQETRRVPGIAGTQVSTLAADRDGRTLWVGTNDGLDRLDLRAETVHHYPGVPDDPAAISEPLIRSLCCDRSGRVWIGTASRGVNRLDPATGDVTRFPFDTQDPAGIEDDQVTAICEDGSGTLWFGVLPSGLHRFDPATSTFERFTRSRDDRLPRSIQSIAAGPDGSLWIGSYSDGLVRFDPTRNGVTRWSRSSGLPDNHIVSILLDDGGRVWLGTERGLARLDPESGDVHVYTPVHGVQNDRFTLNAAARAPDGELFFGGIDGINSFRPDSLRLNDHLPPVVITSLTVQGPDGFRRLSGAQALRALTLGPRENFFTVEFVALDYAEPARNRYEYRLDGQDGRWIDNGNRRTATYTNLDPGAYTLRIRAANNDGVWNEAGIALPITIRPPFWRTRAFLFALGFVLVSAAGTLYRSRILAARRKTLEIERIRQAENERVRKQAARDFHDELGHLVTRISLFGEILSRRMPAGDSGSSAYAEKIVATSKRLSQGMGDFIWMLDPDQDSLREVAFRLKDFGDHLYDGTGIAFRAPAFDEAMAGVPLPLPWRRHLMLVFKEAMHNALKHGGAGNVTLEFTADRGTVTVILADDGAGFDTAAPSAGQGLRSMAARSAQLGGTLTIESRPGSGTRVIFTGRPPEPGGSHTNGRRPAAASTPEAKS